MLQQTEQGDRARCEIILLLGKGVAVLFFPPNCAI